MEESDGSFQAIDKFGKSSSNNSFPKGKEIFDEPECEDIWRHLQIYYLPI